MMEKNNESLTAQQAQGFLISSSMIQELETYSAPRDQLLSISSVPAHELALVEERKSYPVELVLSYRMALKEKTESRE